MVAFIVLVFTVALLFFASWQLFLRSKRMQLHERMAGHMRRIIPSAVNDLTNGQTDSIWLRLKMRASVYLGFPIKSWHLLVIPAMFLLLALFAGHWTGLLGAVLALLLSLFIFGFILPYLRWQRRHAAIVAQIPMFIDQILRALSTGRSVEGAIRLACVEMQPPLLPILERVVRSTDLGADLAETLADAAELHHLREMSLLAMAIRISNVYGSSPREMLQSVVHMIRQREAARRELAAMTGETQISAWVLGITPVAIATYMMLVNPSYMGNVIHDPSSRVMLEVALGLQIAGALIIWRMLKNV